MAEDPKDPPAEDPPEDQVDPDNDPNDPDNDPDQGKPKDPPKDPELEKAIKRRDAALAGRKKAEEEAAALREKYEKDKTDPIKVANTRLVKAEARTVLTAAGITDKADQATVMRFLDLESVSVGTDGDVDAADLEGRVEELAAIFGKKDKPKKSTPRTDTRDRGGDKGNAPDAASARRRAMLGY